MPRQPKETTMKKPAVHVYVKRNERVVIHRKGPRRPKKSAKSGLFWKIVGAGALLAALS